MGVRDIERELVKFGAADGTDAGDCRVRIGGRRGVERVTGRCLEGREAGTKRNMQEGSSWEGEQCVVSCNEEIREISPSGG